MNETSRRSVVWHLLIDRWHTTLRAKALSKETIRGYLFTARRWATWLADQGYDLEPAEVTDTHIEDFIADVVDATSAVERRLQLPQPARVLGVAGETRKSLAVNPMATTEPPNTPNKLTPVFTDQTRANCWRPAPAATSWPAGPRIDSNCSGTPAPGFPKSVTWAQTT